MRFVTISKTIAVLLVVASASFAQWESTDTTKSSAKESGEMSGRDATESSSLSARDEYRYRRSAKTGNVLYKVGSITSWVGLGSFWTGFFIPGPLSGLGFLGLTAGIPLMGIGSGKVQRAATVIDPDASRTGGAGWYLYGAGVGSYLAGFAVVAANLKTDEYGDQTIEPAPAITALSLIAVSQVLYYTAWYQFSQRRALGNVNLNSLSFVPDVRVGENGKSTVGGKLVFGF